MRQCKNITLSRRSYPEEHRLHPATIIASTISIRGDVDGDIDKVALARFSRGLLTGCDPLVRPNWKLFNPALPRSAPHVLTIALAPQCLRADQKFDHPGGCAANKRLLESLDKTAVMGWLQ